MPEEKKRNFNLCFTCKKNIAGKPQKIAFRYKDFQFTILKNGLDCAECAERKYIKKFEKFNGSKLVRIEKGKLIVDWKFHSEAPFRHDLVYILVSLGILSFDSEGNWNIVGASKSLNPQYGELYFTRKEDAVKYAQVNHADIKYRWEIRHITEVLSKEEVLQ